MTQRDDSASGSLGGSGALGPGDVTRLLAEFRAGRREALDQVLAVLYDDLRALARRQLRRELHPPTIEPTALVHEVYLKLVRGVRLAPSDRAHVMAIAARAMRQVLVDHARSRRAAKRAGAWAPVTLTHGVATSTMSAEDLLALDDALDRLEPRQRQIVECRFFAGMEHQEIAALLDVTERTVQREWAKARARLNLALHGPVPAAGNMG